MTSRLNKIVEDNESASLVNRFSDLLRTRNQKPTTEDLVEVVEFVWSNKFISPAEQQAVYQLQNFLPLSLKQTSKQWQKNPDRYLQVLHQQTKSLFTSDNHYSLLLSLLFDKAQTEEAVRRIVGFVKRNPETLVQALELSQKMVSPLRESLQLNLLVAARPATPPARFEQRVYLEHPLVENYGYMRSLQTSTPHPEATLYHKALKDYGRVLESLDTVKNIQQRTLELMGGASDFESGLAQVEEVVVTPDGKSFSLKAPAAEEGVAKIYLREKSGEEIVLFNPNDSEQIRMLGLDPSKQYQVNTFTTSGRFLTAEVFPDGNWGKTKLFIFDIQNPRSPKIVGEAIERVNLSSVKWLPNGEGFAYTQKPPPNSKDISSAYKKQQAKLHYIDQKPTEDKVLIGAETPGVSIPEGATPYVSFHGKYIVLKVRNGVKSEVEFYIKPLSEIDSNKPWIKVARPEDQVIDFAVHGDEFFFLTEKNAPNGEVRKISLTHPDLNHPSIVVSQEQMKKWNFIVLGQGGDLLAQKDALYLKAIQQGKGNSQIVRIPYGKEDQAAIISLPLSEAKVQFRSKSPDIDGFICAMSGYATPNKHYRFDPTSGQLRELGIETTVKNFDNKDFVIEEGEFPGFDGELTPYTAVFKKDLKFDAKPRPLRFRVYSSYGLLFQPDFRPEDIASMEEEGSAVVYLRIRGSKDKGKSWHEAGKMENKFKGWNDVAAASKFFMTSEKYKGKFQLPVVSGHSAGGILAAMAVLENPNAFSGGILNSPALTLLEKNPFETQNFPEFGKNFDVLKGMSAVAQIQPNTYIPPFLAMVGTEDQNTAYTQAIEFFANLQASHSANLGFYQEDPYGHIGDGGTRKQRGKRLAMMAGFSVWISRLQQFRFF